MGQAVKISGVTSISVDGSFLRLGESEVTYSLAGTEVTGGTGLSGDAYYSETPKNGYIEFEILVDSALKVNALNKLRNAQVISRFGNGQTLTLANAFRVGAPLEVSTNGKTKIRFESGTTTLKGS